MSACPPISAQEILARALGQVPNGSVEISDFDLGMIYTMGGQLVDNAFWIIGGKNLVHSAKYPGIPIVFEISDDLYREYELPIVVLRREDIAAAMRRWHPGTLQYRAPAPGAREIVVNGKKGYDKYIQAPQAVPYDITYSVLLQARNRGGNRGGPISDAQAMLAYMQRRFQPYCCVYVPDSDYTKTGVLRTYQAFAEGYSPQSQVVDTLGRIIGYETSVRVEGALDINDPYITSAVTRPPIVRVDQNT